MSIFIVIIPDGDEKYEVEYNRKSIYKYGNYQHAKEHLDTEKQGYIYEYRDDNYYFVEGK